MRSWEISERTLDRRLVRAIGSEKACRRRERAVSAHPGQWGMKRPQPGSRRATIGRTGLMGSFVTPGRPTGPLCAQMLAAAGVWPENQGKLPRTCATDGR
jgi:hypothetical protein